ncbi:MAG: hypothetical protein GY771_01340 [bacterium]|nr:hypothetical protein [bacterium]
MKKVFTIIALSTVVTLTAAPASGESKADLHPPGEQRPLLDGFSASIDEAEESAALMELMSKAEEYTRARQFVSLLMLLILPIIGLAFIIFKVNKRLYRLFKQRHSPTVWISSLLFGGAAFIALTLIEAYRVFLEYSNGLLYSGYWPVFTSRVAIYFLMTLALIVFIGILFHVVQRSTRLWWISATLVFMTIVLTLGGLYPHRLPLTGVSASAITEGVAVERAYVVSENWDAGGFALFEDNSGHYANRIWATSSLFGNDIIISRGALTELTPFEIEVLLAEAEAARQLGHRPIITLLLTLAVLAVLFVADLLAPYICKRLKTPPPPDSRSLPVFVTTVLIGLIISIPFITGVNRYLESKAIESAIVTTRKPITAIDLYRKQVEFNLSAAQPNGILHLLIDPHPATTDNIAQARTLRQELAP